MAPRVRIQGQTPHVWGICGGTEQPGDDGDGGDDGDDDGGEVGEPVPEGGEECDDGNNEGNDGCSPSCKQERCGDGAVQQKGADGDPNTADDEECDDGNLELGDGCTNRCKVETCGNGKVEYGEECDNGEANSDTESGACRTDCKLPKCNDGVIDVRNDDFGLDEQCDCGPEYADFDWAAANEPGSTLQPYCETVVDGKPSLCHVGNCQAFYCGDGAVFNPGLDNESGTEDDEMCDAGPFNSDGLPEGHECANAAQCEGRPCVDGQCYEYDACINDAGCEHGTCINGKCLEGGCNTNADCKAGSTCNANGNCSHCTLDTDCATGICHPNGLCAPPGTMPPDPTGYGCRMDCKPARCGDGIVDPGEKCDEGEAMMKCNGYPQPACDCAIPSWGSHTPGVGPFNTTCCPENQYCSIWATDTCPANCGVEPPIGVGLCGNHTLDSGEECDTSVDGYQGPDSDWADAQVDYAWRPNRDGTQTAFTSDDGNWLPPAGIEQKFTTIDHEPFDGSSPDGAWIITSGEGTAKTYFHLWDVSTLSANTIFSHIRIRATIDFTGKGTGWKRQELTMQAIYNQGSNSNLYGNDMNAAILEVIADETAHTLTFTLFHSVTGRPMTRPVVMPSTVQVTGRQKIALDAVEIATFGTSLDESYSCTACRIAVCGNQRMEGTEECDDGNTANNDGCTVECKMEICRLPPER